MHLDGDHLATQLLVSSAWNEAAISVIQNEWKQQVSHLPAGRHNRSFTFRFETNHSGLLETQPP